MSENSELLQALDEQIQRLKDIREKLTWLQESYCEMAAGVRMMMEDMEGNSDE